ncbi:MAG: hypothetical protein OES38_13825, partial [Gammaproteobacteria bacterium]|nr:hypothetical protein [Gammaproteobacteria bacterium]
MAVANQRVPWINPTSESGVVPWVILGLTIAYIVTGRLGLLLAEHQENATLIWVPTGLSLAALVLWGKKVWP